MSFQLECSSSLIFIVHWRVPKRVRLLNLRFFYADPAHTLTNISNLQSTSTSHPEFNLSLTNFKQSSTLHPEVDQSLDHFRDKFDLPSPWCPSCHRLISHLQSSSISHSSPKSRPVICHWFRTSSCCHQYSTPRTPSPAASCEALSNSTPSNSSCHASFASRTYLVAEFCQHSSAN